MLFSKNFKLLIVNIYCNLIILFQHYLSHICELFAVNLLSIVILLYYCFGKVVNFLVLCFKFTLIYTFYTGACVKLHTLNIFEEKYYLID